MAGNDANVGYEDGDGALESTSSYNVLGFVDGGNPGVTDGVDGNQLNVSDPLLAPLGDYGGPTETHALLPGSLAIDKGSVAEAAGLTADQRGRERFIGQVDIGAVESGLFVNTTDDELDNIVAANFDYDDL